MYAPAKNWMAWSQLENRATQTADESAVELCSRISCEAAALSLRREGFFRFSATIPLAGHCSWLGGRHQPMSPRAYCTGRQVSPCLHGQRISTLCEYGGIRSRDVLQFGLSQTWQAQDHVGMIGRRVDLISVWTINGASGLLLPWTKNRTRCQPLITSNNVALSDVFVIVTG
jgi:hypothetical protein